MAPIAMESACNDNSYTKSMQDKKTKKQTTDSIIKHKTYISIVSSMIIYYRCLRGRKKIRQS